jgi:hypothetical protein
MRYRLCGKNHWACTCTDVEAQVCLSAVIHDYLETIRWAVLTHSVDSGPGDPLAVTHQRKSIEATSHSEPTLDLLERWMLRNGHGGFIKQK